MYIRKLISHELNDKLERDRMFRDMGTQLLGDLDAILKAHGEVRFLELLDDARFELAIHNATQSRTSDEDEQDLVAVG